jgi:hypothetical protein
VRRGVRMSVCRERGKWARVTALTLMAMPGDEEEIEYGRVDTHTWGVSCFLRSNDVRTLSTPSAVPSLGVWPGHFDCTWYTRPRC